MPYDHTDLVTARTAVARRLGDPGLTFWIADELNILIRESLQIWQTATLNNRTRASFSTTPNVAFYDISPLLSDGSELVLQRTLTAQDIVTRIQYHLMENAGGVVDGSVWVGTETFTLTDLFNAVYRRVNRFLDETGQIVTQSQVSVTSGNGRVDIPTEWIDVRRAGWITPEGSHNVLWRTSEYVADSQFNDWNLSIGRPGAYTVAVTPAKVLQLLPPPDDVGMLDLITVNSLTTEGVLNIFNDFGWVIKWGAIADLLGQDGEARDPDRSQFAEQRWDEGIQLAKIMSTVLRGEINGQVIQSCALFDLDAGVPNWQDAIGSSSNNLAAPNTPAFAGPNLVALYPVPGITLDVPDGKHSITFDVVRNAIIPINDSDFLQVGREWLDTLYDLVAFQASFKMGGQELIAAMPLYKRVFQSAAEANARLKETSDSFPILAGQQDLDVQRLKAVA